MRRLLLSSVLLGAIFGCGNWRLVGNQGQPAASETLAQIFNTTQFYQRLGRLAAGDPLPFVGTVAFAAGPADSVIAVVGISLENRALAFQREGNIFVARYRVTLAFQREGAPSVDLSREEIVRVASFQETLRSDESILFQQVLRILPGAYNVTVAVRDVGSTSESRATQEYTAPGFSPASFSAPILVYQATGRGALADPLSLVLNPRGAVGYGSDTLLAYVEGYGFSGPAMVPLQVFDEQGHSIFTDSLRFRGERPVESQVVRLSPDSVSLGELKLVIGRGEGERTVSALVSFTQAWVVTNFDEMLDLLRYFGFDTQISAMRKAPESEHARLWREFYAETDPNPGTPENEALNRYFGRVSAANQRFTDEGLPGWRTDRGEVYINLGPPDESIESTPGAGNRAIRWTYIDFRLVVDFQDETGFGRLRLTPSSRSEYERVLMRLRRQA